MILGDLVTLASGDARGQTQAEAAAVLLLALGSLGYTSIRYGTEAATMGELERAGLIRRRRRWRGIVVVPQPDRGADLLYRYYAQARGQASATHAFAIGSSVLGFLVMLAGGLDAIYAGSLQPQSGVALLSGFVIQPISLLFFRINAEAKKRADAYLDKLRTDVENRRKLARLEEEIEQIEDPRLRDALRATAVLQGMGSAEIAEALSREVFANSLIREPPAPRAEEPSSVTVPGQAG
ncbi:hypothetical protein [Kitasatospora sp. NPDC059827]|uniref:TRADD-N-associated membrane domain-containing protein n=1 Tax=Kitasatospora sp. NPDC059827 TaxID=3346964 RepID=UPI003654599D